MLRPKMAHETAPATQTRMPTQQGFAEYDIVLKPLSHPESGDICIDESLFAIGRTEPPFASYSPEIVADLSRRHARIFCEYGAVYIADLDSKNGTTVNGVNIQQKISRLHNGDEICFGRSLSYRVQFGARVQTQRLTVRLASLTLTPERSDAGLQPIVITQFPFLISKADDVFARYKNECPHQVHYLSRRHAHIFLKGGLPFIEDLGSTNGTFVNDKRMDEHALPLQDGDAVAFGGHHFVYVVSLQKEDAELDPTVTKLTQSLTQSINAPRAPPTDPDKTTFVAAADSFLDIFCLDQAPPQEEEPRNDELKEDNAPGGRWKQGRFGVLLSYMVEAFRGHERIDGKRIRRWGIGVAAALALLGLTAYFSGSSEQELKDLLAQGEYGRAVTVADRVMARDPNNAELQALGTEALLKAYLPQWLERLKAREFDRANAILGGMKQAAARNPDMHGLVDELEWLSNLERFVAGRGGTDAPLKLYADEDRIKALLQRWDDDTQAHQRALARIAAYVPAFRDFYAEALSHLRRLQSEDAVYMTAMERLKSAIATELNQDRPQALGAVLDEYAQKYPRIAGLDSVRQDLRRYMEIDREVRERNLGRLAAQLAATRFATPPFQAKLHALAASDRFPSNEVLQQYGAVSKAWHEGNIDQALVGLQKMKGGSWADGVAKELERKQGIAQQFTDLQKARGTKDYDQRLETFYSALDLGEDTYFVRAMEPDLAQYRDKILTHAQERVAQANALWHQYRENGAIEGGQHLEGTITDKFRSQARVLSQAQDNTRQGIPINRPLKADNPPQRNSLQQEIDAELELQRKSLQELSAVLEPALLKSKLELLGNRER